MSAARGKAQQQKGSALAGQQQLSIQGLQELASK
jgi:hypothetical protein